MLDEKIKKIKKSNKKFIVVTGGVISGLGKGVTSASIAVLLGKKKVIPIKCDGYLNVDPGTMNPVEHGEVFVLDDGGEVDMDFGHYERFIGIKAKKNWNLTMGKVYLEIINKERQGKFLGKTLQIIPHVTDHIKDKIYDIALNEDSDTAIVEIGGTVGDIENELYIEATRQMQDDLGKENVIYVHLAYIPIPKSVNEPKSKPAQQSVKLLNERGIWPNIIIARCENPINENIRKKISLFTNVPETAIISGHDVETVYDVPLSYKDQGLKELLEELFNEKYKLNLSEWEKRVQNLKKAKKSEKSVKIAICGKYTVLHDSYASIIEALSHVSGELGTKIETCWVDTEVSTEIKGYDGIIVPGGFGSRGIEGKIQIIKNARENNVPFLGICYGLQLAVIEYARNVLNIKEATTAEVNEKSNKKIIDIMPEQKNISDKGGTMRLGLYEASLEKGSFIQKIYSSKKAHERHRHRYEVNPEYHEILQDGNMIFSGKSPDGRLVEFIELKNHPCFIATQAHPELKSSLLKPAPMFLHLVKACLKNKD